ncbi:MAG: hypothetical protein KC736_02910 [Candidatus Moranbacteria bacterium]|nr:hypothetical protein [Candidatus Moranbacteria bacterium]
MKNLIVVGIVVIIGIAGYFIGTDWGAKDDTTNLNKSSGSDDQRTTNQRNIENFNPDVNIRGRVMSISDTQIVVGTFAQRQNTAGGFDRTQMENMTDEERQAQRAQRQEERVAQGEPEITGEKVITLTDETKFVKGFGGFGGGRGQGVEGEDVQVQEVIERSAIKEGETVTVILKEGTQEAESVSLQQQ